jgi:CheY-like chemotaxis protein
VRRDVPVHVVGDAARLRQILHNLIANAVKFTADGEVHVSAAVEPGAEGAPWLRLAVRDTGIGMTAALRGRLFEAFAQGDASTTRRYGGTGLGLAISRELADLLGGRIGVESEPERGSTFTLHLPLTTVAAPVALSSGAADTAPLPPALTGRRIGIVSPTASLRQALADVVDAAGGACEPFIALPESGALAQARVAGVDVVLLDDTALATAGLDAAAWFARLAEAGLRGVLLRRLGGPSPGLPDGCVVLYKPARPAAVVDALCRALAPPVPGHASAQAADTRDKSHPDVPLREVLLVEDHPVNQLVARAMLESLGLHVTLAANGIEAIRLFARPPGATRFGLVLMDCQMPEIDGLECTRRLREIEMREGRPRTPIVAFTADGQAEVGAACIAAGMDAFLTKPVRREQLRAVLDRWAPAEAG